MSTCDMLADLGVYKVVEHRSGLDHGVPVTKFYVWQKGFDTPHEFMFAKANHMNEEHQVQVMRSYLRKNINAQV